MVHGTDETSWVDHDYVSGLDVFGIHRVFVGADLVGVNGFYGVDCPSVFGHFKNFLSSFCYFELACHLNHF
jgi:hypothetical protein